MGMIIHKLNQACSVVRVTRSILSPESPKMICYAYFKPIITYGLVFGGNSSQCQHI